MIATIMIITWKSLSTRPSFIYYSRICDTFGESCRSYLAAATTTTTTTVNFDYCLSFSDFISNQEAVTEFSEIV